MYRVKCVDGPQDAIKALDLPAIGEKDKSGHVIESMTVSEEPCGVFIVVVTYKNRID